MMTPPKRACLIVLTSGHSISLTAQEMLIGRQDPVLGVFPDLTFTDNKVARRQARLRHTHGMFTIEDLASFSQTRLNGYLLPPHQEHPLHDSDVLHVGPVDVRFEVS